MKKIFLSLAATLVLCSYAWADRVVGGFRVPQDREGSLAASVWETGVSVFGSSVTASTRGVVGPLAVFGVLTSTASNSGGNGATMYGGGAYVLLWSTNTPANLVGGVVEYLVPPISISSAAHNTLVVFDPPVISTEGVAMYVTSNSCSAAFFYRYLSTGGVGGRGGENLLIPVDDAGVKAHDPGFYGVEPATDSVPGGRIGADGTDTLDYNSSELIVYGSTTPLGGPDSEKYLWYGWIAGTSTLVFGGAGGAVGGNYMVVADTASTVGTADFFMPPIVYPTMSVDARNSAQSGTYTRSFSWPWPIILREGFNLTRVFTNGSADSFRALGRPARQLRHK